MFLGLVLDPLYFIIVGPFFLLAIYASIKVKSTFSHYSKEPGRRGITGAEAAASILRASGIGDVGIEEHEGFLSDHYDPSRKMLRLSPDIYHGTSVASLGVAAHEVGHAIQHAHGYAPLHARSFMVPMAGFGSWLAMPLIFLGIVFKTAGLIKVGIIFFAAVVLFQLITLPVEFDASRRAKLVLAELGMTAGMEEDEGVRKVLSAAAMTYVAATLVAIAELVYYLLLANRMGDD